MEKTTTATTRSMREKPTMPRFGLRTATKMEATVRGNAARRRSAAIIKQAGAIRPLVALLSGGPESKAAQLAAGTLRSLALDDAGRAAILESSSF